MTNPNLTDELQTHIQNYLRLSKDYILNYCEKIEKNQITDAGLKAELIICLTNYCDENNLSLDVKKTVEEFLTKRGGR